VEDPTSYQDALRKALKNNVTTVIEVLVETKFPYSGSIAYGYWDIPSPYVHD